MSRSSSSLSNSSVETLKRFDTLRTKLNSRNFSTCLNFAEIAVRTIPYASARLCNVKCDIFAAPSVFRRTFSLRFSICFALVDQFILGSRTFVQQHLSFSNVHAKMSLIETRRYDMSSGTNKMLNSPIRWVGGKSRLRKHIIPLIPPHTCYVELFAGGAWVLFGKQPSPVEVLNDIDQELINFFFASSRDSRRI